MAVAKEAEPRAVELPARGTVRAAVVALRPDQWTKNLVVLAAIIFAVRLDEPARLRAALAAFVAYCAASSAAYLVNDALDAPRDRLHPTKRTRPVASGELSRRSAVWLAGALAAGALALSAPLSAEAVLLLGAFLALQLAYSLGLKHVVLLDVVAIAALFVLRAAGGAVAIDVPPSAWLLACTALLALFLGLAKRRAELVLLGGGGASRPALARYSVVQLDRLLWAAAAASVAAFAAYVATVHGAAMLLTIVPVALGVGRYLMLVRRRDLGAEPERVLLRDRPTALAVALWVVASAVILERT